MHSGLIPSNCRTYLSQLPIQLLTSAETQDVINNLEAWSRHLQQPSLSFDDSHHSDFKHILICYKSVVTYLVDLEPNVYSQTCNDGGLGVFLQLHAIIYCLCARHRRFLELFIDWELPVSLIDLLSRPELNTFGPENFYYGKSLKNSINIIIDLSFRLLWFTLQAFPLQRGPLRARSLVPTTIKFFKDAEIDPVFSPPSYWYHLPLHLVRTAILAFASNEYELSKFTTDYDLVQPLFDWLDKVSCPLSSLQIVQLRHVLQVLLDFSFHPSCRNLLLTSSNLILIGELLADCSNGQLSSTFELNAMLEMGLDLVWSLLLPLSQVNDSIGGRLDALVELASHFVNSSFCYSNACQFKAALILLSNRRRQSIKSLTNYSSVDECRQSSSGELILVLTPSSTEGVMLRLCEELVLRNHQVAMDFCEFYNPTTRFDSKDNTLVDDVLDSVKVLVVGVSQALAHSPRCYQWIWRAHEARKPIFPIQIESDYVTYGWLDLALTTIIYAPLTNVDSQLVSCTDQVERWLARIEERNCCQLDGHSDSTDHQRRVDLFNHPTIQQFLATLSNTPNLARLPNLETPSMGDVLNWLLASTSTSPTIDSNPSAPTESSNQLSSLPSPSTLLELLTELTHLASTDSTTLACLVVALEDKISSDRAKGLDLYDRIRLLIGLNQLKNSNLFTQQQ